MTTWQTKETNPYTKHSQNKHYRSPSLVSAGVLRNTVQQSLSVHSLHRTQNSFGLSEFQPKSSSIFMGLLVCFQAELPFQGEKDFRTLWDLLAVDTATSRKKCLITPTPKPQMTFCKPVSHEANPTLNHAETERPAAQRQSRCDHGEVLGCLATFKHKLQASDCITPPPLLMLTKGQSKHPLLPEQQTEPTKPQQSLSGRSFHFPQQN